MDDGHKVMVKVPAEVIVWLARFEQEGWSGSLTLHFNRGMILSYEPKPNLRTTPEVRTTTVVG